MTAKIEFSEMVKVFAKIGCLSFGGPAGQIALMHREIVDDRQWVSEDQYLHALNFCHLLPGPEAQQLATWIGWRLHGLKGGLAAGALFVLPGAVIILILSMLYGAAAHLDWFAALFLGIKAAVLALVVQALLRIGGRALNTGFKRLVALIAFACLFLLNLPFPVVVLGAGLLGLIITRYQPALLGMAPAKPSQPYSGPSLWPDTLKTILIWLIIWMIPMVLIFISLGPEHVLWKIGSFFSQLAVVTFGGAYAVLAYMAQEAVQTYGWLQPGEMADGLGLAESTPGPLIMVTQFVGYLAAFRSPEPFTPLVAGMIGALVTSWVTFTPCFLWIFTFAPWIERLENATQLKGGLATLTAAVVGVIANLTLWFALHVLFRTVLETQYGPFKILQPLAASFNWPAAILALIAAILLFRFRWNILQMLTFTALAGLLLGTLT